VLGMAGGTGCHETTTTKTEQQHTQLFSAAASTEKCRCCIDAKATKAGDDDDVCGAGGLERPNSGRDWREAQRRAAGGGPRWREQIASPPSSSAHGFGGRTPGLVQKIDLGLTPWM